MRNDDAYSNMKFIPGGEAFPARWEVVAPEFRRAEAAVGRARLNEPYGEDERHRFDLFYPAGKPEGLIVFIHGGYWWTFGREAFSHLARGATERGWAFALPSYRLAPTVRIRDITRDIARAVTRIADFVAGPMVITGHSAGGHLSARMLCGDVGLPVLDRVRRVVAVSPLVDLRPLLEMTLNEQAFRLDEAEAVEESPALNGNVAPVETVSWVGGAERPAFIDQARWLAAAWPHARLHIDPRRHHFDVIEGYEDKDSPLVRTLVGAA